MYYSRDCLLLFYFSWVNIISLMSWIYCREGCASTAAILSRVSECYSSAEVVAAVELSVEWAGDTHIKLMTVWPHPQSRWRRQREIERLMKTITYVVRKRGSAEKNTDSMSWSGGRELSCNNWGSNKTNFFLYVTPAFLPLQQQINPCIITCLTLFLSSVFIFFLHKAP